MQQISAEFTLNELPLIAMMKRLCRKKNRDIIFTLLLLFILIVVWLNLYFTRTLGEKYSFVDCILPCHGVNCGACSNYSQKSADSVDVISLLNLKHLQRSSVFVKNAHKNKLLLNTEQVCKKPNFDLSHDSVKYAFFSMKALNCTGTKLFYKEYTIFRLNTTVLHGKKIAKCYYYGMSRLNDDFHQYTEPYVKEEEPFDLRFKQDFVHIKCYLQKNVKETLTVHDTHGNGEKLHQVEDIGGNKLINDKDVTIFVNGNDIPKIGGDKDRKYGTHDNVTKGNKASNIPNLVKVLNSSKIATASNNINDNTKADRKGKVKWQHKPTEDGTKSVQKDISNPALYYKKPVINEMENPGNSNHNQKEEKKAIITNKGVNIDKKLTQENANSGLHYKMNDKKEITYAGEYNKKTLKLQVANSGLYHTKPDTRKLLEASPDNREDENINSKNDDEEEDIPYYDPFEGYETHEFADFEQLMVQVFPKQDVFDRIARQVRHRKEQRYMDVMMIGLDSMSHLSFQRKLPLTYKYLQDKLKAVILDGYNIVGDATTAAMIPMLTGKFETELPEVRRQQYQSNSVDIYPMIWKKFQKHGYVTMFAEDEPTIGMFNLRLSGFNKQPTDHYMRPFWQALWDSELRRSAPRYCTGYKPNHEYLLDYLKDFYTRYDNVSKFSLLFGSELTHWDNNPGEYMDKDLMNLLEYFEDNGYLKNTLLIVMGDHGARYSRVRKTIQGKMEERLPMMSLRFPEWFQEKYPRVMTNLHNNVNKLTTPFDIHETLLDVLDLKRTEHPLKHSRRSFSLLQSIPLNRTCASSDIQMHWCTCLKQVTLEPTDKHVIKSAQSVMKFINGRTKSLRDKCALLTVKQILQAQLLIPNEKVLMFQKSQDDDQRVANFTQNVNIDHTHFQITIETTPNKGLYEATVQVNMTAQTYTVIDDVSRLNLYGNQPLCVQENYPDLRKYCYCNNASKKG